MMTLKKIRYLLVVHVNKLPLFSFYARLIYNLLFGEKELRFLLKNKSFFKKYIFIDIGANLGIYTALALIVFRKIYAFEPLKILENHWIYISKKTNIIYNNLAIGNNNKTGYLTVPKHDSITDHGLSKITNKKNEFCQKTKISRLDDLLLNKFDDKDLIFIKIDVEGFENEVIEGATNILKLHNPIILIEIESRHNSKISSLITDLTNLNYGIYYLKYNKLIKVNIDFINEQKFGTPNYINNYICISSEKKYNNILSVC